MKGSYWIAALAAVLSWTSAAQGIQVSKENKTIAISTSDDASMLADTAVVSVGFQSFGKDQQATYAEAAQTSTRIISALTGAGLPKESIESIDQGLRPLEANGEDNKARYAEGLRFSFSQDWRLTLPADQVAKALQVAIAAGGNNSGNIEWRLKDDNGLQAQAVGKALAHAREIAASMAKGLDVTIGGLVHASNQEPPRPFGMGMGGGMGMGRAMVMAEKANALGPPLAITPQRITRSATVYAVFAIE